MEATSFHQPKSWSHQTGGRRNRIVSPTISTRPIPIAPLAYSPGCREPERQCFAERLYCVAGELYSLFRPDKWNWSLSKVCRDACKSLATLRRGQRDATPTFVALNARRSIHKRRPHGLILYNLIFSLTLCSRPVLQFRCAASGLPRGMGQSSALIPPPFPTLDTNPGASYRTKGKSEAAT